MRWWVGQYLHEVIKWKHFPRNWPFVRGIHRSPVNFPHKGQWRGSLMFFFICVWINDWVNNDLRRVRTHYDVIVMSFEKQACRLSRAKSLSNPMRICNQLVQYKHNSCISVFLLKKVHFSISSSKHRSFFMSQYIDSSVPRKRLEQI